MRQNLCCSRYQSFWLLNLQGTLVLRYRVALFSVLFCSYPYCLAVRVICACIFLRIECFCGDISFGLTTFSPRVCLCVLHPSKCVARGDQQFFANVGCLSVRMRSFSFCSFARYFVALIPYLCFFFSSLPPSPSPPFPVSTECPEKKKST